MWLDGKLALFSDDLFTWGNSGPNQYLPRKVDMTESIAEGSSAASSGGGGDKPPRKPDEKTREPQTVPRQDLLGLIQLLLRQLIGDGGIAKFGTGSLEAYDVERVLTTSIPSAETVSETVPQSMDEFFARYGHTWQGKAYSLSGSDHSRAWGFRTEDINASRQYAAAPEDNDVAKLISNLLKLYRVLQRRK